MARLYIEEFLSFGADPRDIIETEWVVYENINGAKGDKLFESLNDSINKTKIVATLKKDGMLFDVNKPTIVTVRIRTDSHWKKWVEKTCTGKDEQYE